MCLYETLPFLQLWACCSSTDFWPRWKLLMDECSITSQGSVSYAFCAIVVVCWRVCFKQCVLGAGEWTSSCGNISNIYSPPLSAVARAFEEQSNIRRWSEDSPFKPQGFIWERIPSVHRICSHFIWIHLFLRWKREERGSEKNKTNNKTTGKKQLLNWACLCIILCLM